MTDEEKEIIRKQLIIDYQTVFDTECGRRVYADLEQHCHYNTLLDCDSAMILSQLTAMRNVFLYIKSQIADDPNREIQTQSEIE